MREDFGRYYDEMRGWMRGSARHWRNWRNAAGGQHAGGVHGRHGAALLRGKGTLYEFGIHVPLLVRWPGVVKGGAAAEAMISGEDLAPTFLAAAGWLRTRR